MNEQTFSKRLHQLVTLVHNHPKRDELLSIMAEQVADDTDIIADMA